MRQFVKSYIKNYIICTVKKTRSVPLLEFVNPVAQLREPFDSLHMDHCPYQQKVISTPMEIVTTETRGKLQNVFAPPCNPKRIIKDVVQYIF